jgi:CheY-like chemotaxis protein
MLQDASRKSAGSGLGLSIVKRTAHLLGMRIRTESAVGVGSTFYLQLPTNLPRSNEVLRPIASHGKLSQAHNVALNGLVVAVIDDVLTVRNSICRILNAHGMRTIDAASWGEMVPMLHEVTPDLLITDYQLEFDASGYDVVIAARKHISETLPCFIITGDTSPDLVRTLAGLNVVTLYKPLSTESLLAEIQRHIGARSQ